MTRRMFGALVVVFGLAVAAPASAQLVAAKDGPIVPLIAETGGINAMIVDATALPEQVTDDVVASAFRSAGQRCSALRLLCVQDNVADRMIEMIAGAAKELSLGDPGDPSTHVGPVIDPEAKTRLDAWMCDLKEMRIGDGLHVFGRADDDPVRSACALSERRALLAALDGRFIEPGPAGAPGKSGPWPAFLGYNYYGN